MMTHSHATVAPPAAALRALPFASFAPPAPWPINHGPRMSFNDRSSAGRGAAQQPIRSGTDRGPQSRPAPPTLHILAGPEGAGKTTFYEQTILSGARLPAEQRPTYISPDRVQSHMLGEQGNRAYGAGNQIAHQQAREVLKTGKPLVTETTFSDPRDLRLVEEAKAAGYRVVLHHLQTNSVNLSVARVAARVAEGGRDAPEAQVRADYQRAPALIAQAAQKADLTFVHDSSALNQEPKHLLTMQQGRIVAQARELPTWAREAYAAPLREAQHGRMSAAERSFASAVNYADRRHPGAQVQIAGHKPDQAQGRAVHHTAHHLLQETKPGHYVAHFKERLAVVPQAGQDVTITYGADRDKGRVAFGPDASKQTPEQNKADKQAYLTLPRDQAEKAPRVAAAHHAADALRRVADQAQPRNEKVAEQVDKVIQNTVIQRLETGRPLEIDRPMVEAVRYNVALKSLDNALSQQIIDAKPQQLHPEHRDILVTRAEGVMRAIDGRVPMVQPVSQAQKEAQLIAQRLATLDGPKAQAPFRHNELTKTYRDAQKGPQQAPERGRGGMDR